MKRFFLFSIFLVIFCQSFGQADTLSITIKQLIEAIQKIPELDSKRQDGINELKQTFATTGETDLQKLFQVYESLYSAYELFQYDSAYNYARKLKAVSLRMQNKSLINYARIKLGFILLSSGMYKETLDSLASVDLSAVNDSGKAEYYALLGRYYYDLGDYDNDQYHTPAYNRIGGKYVDSALALWNPDQYEYLYYDGLKKLKGGNKAAAKLNFDRLLSRNNLTSHQVAVTASTLSDLYIQNSDNDKAIALLAKAVMADIESSTKETSAAFILSTLLYKKGDIKNASLCINQAFADAVFYGARQRKVQVSAILPVIEAQKLAIVESQKTKLMWYAVLVTFLLLLVIGLAFVVIKQVKKLKIAQKALLEAHQKTQEINKRLSETNEKLNDANKIKEEYIGYFFNVNSEFFDKIERFKRSIEQKIADRKIDEIKFLVNNINLKREKEDLLKHFDRAFLKLFPNFVGEFNELFNEEDRIELKEDELLNTDLRIFALARMGIHENEKIAHILQYSVNTINTYKTKIKNKSIVPNEEFEKRIMKIRTVQ
ncbi:MAG TPA: DUF6377 domain-containing protein [Chitinophagaceae bacterium]|nr:DUF6377 domain-containing protein [Chitinophagaceae bacterium]